MPAKKKRPMEGIYIYRSAVMTSPMGINCNTGEMVIRKNNIPKTTSRVYFFEYHTAVPKNNKMSGGKKNLADKNIISLG